MRPRQNRWDEPTYLCAVTLPSWLEKSAPTKQDRVVDAYYLCDLWKTDGTGPGAARNVYHLSD
jgi:hypothetical protein